MDLIFFWKDKGSLDKQIFCSPFSKNWIFVSSCSKFFIFAPWSNPWHEVYRKNPRKIASVDSMWPKMTLKVSNQSTKTNKMRRIFCQLEFFNFQKTSFSFRFFRRDLFVSGLQVSSVWSKFVREHVLCAGCHEKRIDRLHLPPKRKLKKAQKAWI